MVNKAELRGYSEEPFFKTDKDYDQGRIIAWAGDVERQAQLFWSLAEALGERIDYLLKVELDVNEKASQWRRIFGNILLSDLKVAIKSHDELFFHDSGFLVDFKSSLGNQIVENILHTMNTVFSGYTRMMNVSLKFLRNQDFLNARRS